MGRVWATERNERRDVARLHGFKTIIFTFLEGVVVETALGEHVATLDPVALNTLPTKIA